MVNDDRLVLVFDAGTQSTRGFLFNRKGDIVASAKTKNHISDESDIPNRHEKDAEEYWREISRVSLELKEISCLLNTSDAADDDGYVEMAGVAGS